MQIDFRRIDRSLGRRHFSASLTLSSDGVIIILTADHVIPHQLIIPVHPCIGIGNRGLGTLQISLGTGQFGLIRGGINLIQLLTGLNQRAFLKQALLNDAGHLWAYLGNTEGRGATGQFGTDLQRFFLNRIDSNSNRLRRTTTGGSGLLFIFTGGRQSKGNHKDCRGQNTFHDGNISINFQEQQEY